MCSELPGRDVNAKYSEVRMVESLREETCYDKPGSKPGGVAGLAPESLFHTG